MLDVENLPEKRIESNVDLINEEGFPCWYANVPEADYINLLAFNEAGEVMIIEDLTANSAWGSWHLVSGLIKDGENPLTAVERRLLELTGYQSNNWLYLGSFMLNARYPNAAGHFFSARHVIKVSQPRINPNQMCAVRWISRQELKLALIDGRIGMVNYAVTASLALLMLPIDPVYTPDEQILNQ